MHQHESTIGIRVSLPSWTSFPPPPTTPSRLSQSPGLSSLSHTANTLQYSCLENSMDGEAWRVQSEGSRESDRTEWLSVCPQGCEEASVPGLSSWLLDGIFQIAFPVCLSVFKFLSLSLSLFFGCTESSLWHVGLVAPQNVGILVLWPGIGPASPALQGRFLTSGPQGRA